MSGFFFVLVFVYDTISIGVFMIEKSTLSVKDTKGKYIFWDIDGTLAPYRFNGHVADPDGTENGMSLKEIEDGIFLIRQPSKRMQKIVSECQAKRNIILGHAQNQKEIDDKHIWLDKYYPEIKERLLVRDTEFKYEQILKYCKKNKIDLKDVLFIDDVIPFLRQAERHGISAWHISSFYDWGL